MRTIPDVARLRGATYQPVRTRHGWAVRGPLGTLVARPGTWNGAQRAAKRLRDIAARRDARVVRALAPAARVNAGLEVRAARVARTLADAR